MQRRFAINSYQPGPYVAAEVFYQSQYSNWTTTALYAGCLLPLGNTSSSTPTTNVANQRPNQQSSSSALSLVCTSCQYVLLASMYFLPLRAQNRLKEARKSSESVDTCPTRRMIFALPL